VALVIVRAPLDLPWTHRQQRLRAIEGLDLALLIDADHQRLVGRIEIEPDDVAHLLDELRIGGELERLRPMRLQRERAPDALHRGRRDTRRLRHVAGAPVRRALRLLLERLDHDGFDLVVADLARRTASGLVAEAVEAVLGKPLAPRAHGLARDADLGGDRAIVEPVGGEQHDLRALRSATRDRAPSNQTVKIGAFRAAERDDTRLRCPPRSHDGLRHSRHSLPNHSRAKMA